MGDRSNLERWSNIMRDIKSPSNFITMGFYSMIASCLQRRVWTGPAHAPLYSNLYTMLVGPPGVGKGLVIGQVNNFLKHHKLNSKGDIISRNLSTNTMEVTPENTPEFFEAAEGFKNNAGKNKELPLLFPVAADCTTFQALTRAFVTNSKHFKCPKAWYAPNGFYLHKSLTFCLEELSSLINRDSALICKFLLGAWDCKDYDYDTKHQGADKLRRPCLNFLAGTTPSSIKEIFHDNLIGDGFTARTIFVFEFANRFPRYGVGADYDEEQKADRDHLLNHIKDLSKLIGQAVLTPEAEAFFKQYIEKDMMLSPAIEDTVMRRGRRNPSIKLEPYYARKGVMLTKMACAIHFADSLELKITLEDAERAFCLLDNLERNMHYALNFGANPLAAVSKNIIAQLRNVREEGMTLNELWCEFSEHVRMEELLECIKFCIATEMITTEEIKQTGKETIVKYKYMKEMGR